MISVRRYVRLAVTVVRLGRCVPVLLQWGQRVRLISRLVRVPYVQFDKTFVLIFRRSQLGSQSVVFQLNFIRKIELSIGILYD